MGRHPPVACIAISDLHLTLTPPSCRAEKDWLEVQEGYFQQVKDFHDQVGGNDFPIPIICAGDIFDRPSPPVELVNWAIRTLPNMYAVPGQHDLKFHSLADIHKSGYWTLCEAGAITNLPPNKPLAIGGVRLHGFPWGTEITPWPHRHNLALEIAVVHKYVWTRGTGYPDAPKEARAVKLQDALVGYDVALVGDNHTPFDLMHSDLCSLVNCGTFCRRKQNERGHKPSIVVVYQSGECARHYLDVSKDQFNEQVAEKLADHSQITDFVSSLSTLTESKVDFAEALRRYANDHASEEVRNILLAILEEVG